MVPWTFYTCLDFPQFISVRHPTTNALRRIWSPLVYQEVLQAQAAAIAGKKLTMQYLFSGIYEL